MAKEKVKKPKKTAKQRAKIIGKVVLVIVLIIALAVGAIAILNGTTTKSLRNFVNEGVKQVEYTEQLKPEIGDDGYYTFTTDRDFKIVQLTDVHIGGGIMSEDYIIELIDRKIYKQLMENFRKVNIVNSKLGNQAALLGVAYEASNI